MNCIVCQCKLTGKQKKFCSVTCKNSYSNNRLQNYIAQQLRALDRKLRLIELSGGECATCGYRRNTAALVFHHIKDKEFSLDLRSLSNRSWTRIVAEHKKCVLLCANCHAELHNPQYKST